MMMKALALVVCAFMAVLAVEATVVEDSTVVTLEREWQGSFADDAKFDSVESLRDPMELLLEEVEAENVQFKTAGRTPLTPSQGYGSHGFSRSPSSRSIKPGTKSSLVSVVNFTRPVSP